MNALFTTTLLTDYQRSVCWVMGYTSDGSIFEISKIKCVTPWQHGPVSSNRTECIKQTKKRFLKISANVLMQKMCMPSQIRKFRDITD